MIWLRTPQIREGRTFDRTVCAKVLGLGTGDLLDATPQLVSAGNPTIFIALKDKDAVDRAWLDSHGSIVLKGEYHEPMCVFVFTPTPYGAYSRMFAPEYGIVEDPATGSSTGPLAAFMIRHGLISGAAGTRFISEQGTKMGRRSILHVHILGDRGQNGIDVGGNVVPVVEAIIFLQLRLFVRKIIFFIFSDYRRQTLSRKTQFITNCHTYSFFTIIQTKYAQGALLCGIF